MSDPGFASLGPSLLARKGGAKPAMRPQVAPLVADKAAIAALAEEQLEDLGWNDMGDPDDTGGAEIVPINAEVAADQRAAGQIAAGHGPIVRRQQRGLEMRVLADAAMTGPEDDASCAEEDEDEAPYGEALAGEHEHAALPAPSAAPAPARAPRAAAKARVPSAQAGRRAAFTLRLDADRHLKLRLAATMQGVSAQALVTDALDRLLADYDELDVIANHLKRH